MWYGWFCSPSSREIISWYMLVLVPTSSGKCKVIVSTINVFFLDLYCSLPASDVEIPRAPKESVFSV